MRVYIPSLRTRYQQYSASSLWIHHLYRTLLYQLDHTSTLHKIPRQNTTNVRFKNRNIFTSQVITFIIELTKQLVTFLSNIEIKK